MDINVVTQLVELIKSSGLSAIEVEENGMKIRLENDGHTGVLTSTPDITTGDIGSIKLPKPSVFPAAPVSTAPASAEPADEDCYYVKSPMVGVFCSLEKIGKKQLAAGDKVSRDTVVCALEAMKMIVEVESEVEGEFVKVLAKDGDQIEFGQQLVKIKKA